MSGYVRQSTAEILPNLVILADSFNKEFNAVQGAFNSTTGHTHDGTTGNGPKINLTTSVSSILPTANGGTGTGTLTTVDNTIPRFNGTGGVLQASSVVISDTWVMSGMTQINLGVSNQAAALVRLRTAGQSIEFGHVNTAGYGSAIGAENATGIPYLAFNAEQGTNANTYRTRGIIGTVITSDQLGGFVFSKIATASADNQSKTTLATLSTAGSFAATAINSTPVGPTTPSTGAFTTLSATGGVTFAGGGTMSGVAITTGSIDGAPIGGTTKAAGSFTQVLATNGFVHTDGTHTGLFSAGSGKVIIGSTSAHPLDLLSNSTTVATFNTSGMTLPVNSAITFSGTGAATTRTNLGLGTMATQTASAVAITGGSFNGTVGATTPNTIVSTGITSTTLTVDGGALTSFISKSAASGIGPNALRYNDSAGTLMGYIGYTSPAPGNTNLNLYNALGNVQILASNAVVSTFTSTGMNSTAIGATTPSTVAATTVNATTQVEVGTFQSNGVTSGVRTTTTAINISTTTGTSFPVVTFNSTAGASGNITVAAAGTTAYNTTSDEAFKEFTGLYSFDDAKSIILADPVRRFNWIKERGGASAVGWGAQTSYKVSPDLATPSHGNPGDEDYTPWGIDQGRRTPYLWAAVTGLIKKIEALEEKIESLQNGQN